MKIIQSDQHLELLPERAVFWKETETLFIADAHFGKSGTFRQGGIAIPDSVTSADIQKLQRTIDHCGAKRVIFLGDLFHSIQNMEWQIFSDFLQANLDIEFILIAGNHDILPKELYAGTSLKVIAPGYKFGPFELRHYPPDPNETLGDHFILCGHIHPAVQLSGNGKQNLTLPCYYKTKSFLMLPSFGRFTGNGIIKPEDYSKVYVIADNEVIEV